MNKAIKAMKIIDIKTLEIINARLKNKYLDLVMHTITLLGGFVFNIVVVLVMIFLINDKYKYIGQMIIISTTTAVLITHLVKKIVSRNRPFDALMEIEVIGKRWKDKSFPSAHTATVFSNAVVLSYFTGLDIVFYFLAAFVAISRIYIGVHYLSDVIGGAMIGFITAMIILL